MWYVYFYNEEKVRTGVFQSFFSPQNKYEMNLNKAIVVEDQIIDFVSNF